MKKLRILICIMLVLGCSAAFAACGGARLSKPGGLRIDTDALTLSWIEVPNARYYTVSFNGDERETRKNNFSLSALAPGDYTVKGLRRRRIRQFRLVALFELYARG